VTQITFTAVDGSTRTPAEVPGVKVTQRDGWTVLDIPKNAGIIGAVIGGVNGVVRLTQRPPAVGVSAPAAGAIAPHDGVLEVAAGGVDETLVGDTLFTPGDPAGHAVSFIDPATNITHPATIVAGRTNEIGISAGAVPPSVVQADGSCTVQVNKPDGSTLHSRIGSAWGYELSIPPVAHVGAAAPVTARVYGLKPEQKVRFQFLPGAGQTITPLTVVLTGAQLEGGPMPVAQLQTETAGPQSLDCQIELVTE
jgi:hypothetical protein